MPETVDQPLTPPPQESSPASRVITRIKNAIHVHTPEGRREEYREKWSHVLEGAKGLPRFELERRIGQEADTYARDRVLRDVFVAAAATAAAGLGIGGIVAWRNQSRIRELFQEYGGKVKTWSEQTITNAAAKATRLGLEGVTQTITKHPEHVSTLAERLTTQAATGAGDALRKNPNLVGNIVASTIDQATTTAQETVATPQVQNKVKLIGFDLTSAAVEGATKAAESHAASAPPKIWGKILEAFGGLLTRATGKQVMG
ncbi:MAG: hypothetical protein AAB557_03595 [Patescibacteria group bacterium]